MLLFYVVLLVALALVQVALNWRVRRLERRYVRVAGDADALLKQAPRGGTTNRQDALVAAKHQYALAQVALKRDTVEARYTRWQAAAERFAAVRRALAGYRGKAVPYAVGMLDVVAAVAVLDQYGVGVAQLKALLGLLG